MTVARLDLSSAFVKRPTLAQVRRRQALSQGELAEKAGVSSSVVSLIERGKRRPRMRIIRALASALEMEPTAIDWPGDPLGVGSGK